MLALILDRPFPMLTGMATVARRAAITPRMARFTLAAPAFAELGVEEPGEIFTLGWCDFTIRAYRPEAAEIDVDFFLRGDVGRASAWATYAQPGQTVGYAGPRLHFRRDRAADWTLLAADETGLPALLAIAESLPAGHPVVAVAEIHEDGERQPVAAAADVDLRWASRAGREPGTTTALADALAALPVADGPVQVWGGGAAIAMRAVREHVRGLDVVATDVIGYWKHRATPDDVDD